MPKAPLAEPQATLQHELVETMYAAYAHPESYSDWEWVARAVIRMFEVKRRPIAVDLEYHKEQP